MMRCTSVARSLLFRRFFRNVAADSLTFGRVVLMQDLTHRTLIYRLQKALYEVILPKDRAHLSTAQNRGCRELQEQLSALRGSADNVQLMLKACLWIDCLLREICEVVRFRVLGIRLGAVRVCPRTACSKIPLDVQACLGHGSQLLLHHHENGAPVAAARAARAVARGLHAGVDGSWQDFFELWQLGEVTAIGRCLRPCGARRSVFCRGAELKRTRR